MLRPIPSILAVAALLISACNNGSPGEYEAVQSAIQLRATALNTRNLPLYLSVVSGHYRDDKGRGREQLRADLETAFNRYDHVSYQVEGQSVTIQRKSAKVSGTYRMKVHSRGNETLLHGRERMVFAKESDGWKIITGL